MYPEYFDRTAAETPEIQASVHDRAALGVVCDLNNWYVTPERAARFRQHLSVLLPLAEAGNPLAQSEVAAIYMLGCCYSSESEFRGNYRSDILAMSDWLARAARQGVTVAVDNLVSIGIGPEAERLRALALEVEHDHRSGRQFPPGETWRRAYGTSRPERHES